MFGRRIYEQQESLLKNGDESNKINKNTIYAFPIDNDTLQQLKLITASKDGGIFKSEKPLEYLESSEDKLPTVNGKPIYLMIKINGNIPIETSEEIDLPDRVYIVSNINAKELIGIINRADNYEDRERIYAKSPDGKEHSVAVWKRDAIPGNTIPFNKEHKENVDKAVVQSMIPTDNIITQ